MIDILSDAVVKLLAWIAPFTLRKLYSQERLGGLVKIRVSAESEGVEYCGSDIPHAQAWITISNLSPFEIELDRAFGSFNYSARIEKFVYLQREKINSAAEKTILIETSLTSAQAKVIRQLRNMNPKPGVSFQALFLCPVHDFEVSRTLDTSHHRLVNFDIVS